MVDLVLTVTEIVNQAAPSVVLAIVLLVIGYIIGWLAKFVIVNVVRIIGVDDWFEHQHLLAAVGNKDLSEIIGSIVKWYIFFIFLKQAFEIINLATLNEFVGFWINLALALIAAIVVVIIGLIIGRYARNAIDASKSSLKKFVGLAVELMIVYVAFVMGIRLIGLPAQLLEWTFLIAFGGVVLAASLVVGLGFGLALKDDAKQIVKELRKKK